MKKRAVKKYLFKRGREDKMYYNHHNSPCGGGIYFFGMIGAAIFYIQTATSFWMGVLGILKALVWPAFLVYESLKFLVGY